MKKKKEYLVEWRINVDGEDAIDAAQKAFSIMQDPNTTANIFTVTGNFEKAMKVTVNLQTNKAYRDVR